jgi:squalene-hopene/tetraprenyl-beta-curcumene cyclase
MNPAFQETLARVRERLLAERGAHGHWEGELSSSALSTATAVLALTLVDRVQHAALIRGGLDWLRTHANTDGGWGDTIHSKSNISTTALVWAAFGVMNEASHAAEAWLTEAIRSQKSDVRCQTEEDEHRTSNGQPSTIHPSPSSFSHFTFHISHLPSAIAARYGKDRTFSVPILTACALAGKISWAEVLPLPFELAVLPHQLFRWLRLPVVSYALPALIAIGQVRHHRLPPRNPLVRAVRNRARAPALRVLEKIQPANGGFLEAAPLTSFVVMSLAGMGFGAHPVAAKGVQFLVASARADGSWPIDTNLATWLTTLAVNTLGPTLPAPARAPLRDWLFGQQYRVEHPFTHAAPGGWSWTDLPGGVPDADDTAGALLALRNLEEAASSRKDAKAQGDKQLGDLASWRENIFAGIGCLLDLQNSDGGIPTFCKGWGALPFDRSAPDLTAHALRAFAAWRDEFPPPLQARVQRATRRAIGFLGKAQRADGAWSPLWFGNQLAPGEENLTYGTAQVLRGLQEVNDPQAAVLAVRGAAWLLAAQNPDGSWGGATKSEPSIEETALAVSALAGRTEARAAVERGVDWLISKTDSGRVTSAAPIGLYFAKLWYFERLYPLIFLAGALERVARFQALEK